MPCRWLGTIGNNTISEIDRQLSKLTCTVVSSSSSSVLRMIGAIDTGLGSSITSSPPGFHVPVRKVTEET